LDEQYPDGHIIFEVRPNPSNFSVSSSGKGRGYLQVHFCAPKNISDAILQCCGFSLDSPAITSQVVWILRVAFPFSSLTLLPVYITSYFPRSVVVPRHIQQSRCEPCAERAVKFYSLHTASDEGMGAESETFTRSSGDRGHRKREYELMKLALDAERRVSDQAIATAAAERRATDQAISRADFVERVLMMSVQGSHLALQPRQP
jgi:hypothetical protein